jgi:hypothetical protein
MHRFLLSVFLVITFACKSALPGAQQPSLENWVIQNLGSGFNIQKNSAGTFAICSKDDPATLSTAYYIVRTSDFKVVEKDKIQRALLYWLDDMRVELKFTPGMIKKEDEPMPSKIIDLNKYKIDKL